MQKRLCKCLINYFCLINLYRFFRTSHSSKFLDFEQLEFGTFKIRNLDTNIMQVFKGDAEKIVLQAIDKTAQLILNSFNN